MNNCPKCGEQVIKNAPSFIYLFACGSRLDTKSNIIRRSQECVTRELGRLKVFLYEYRRVRGKSNRSKREAAAWAEVEKLL